MKSLTNSKFLLAIAVLAFGFSACKKEQTASSKTPINNNDITTDLFTTSLGITQVNLVADRTGFGASFIDDNLVNSWGIASPPGGPIWIADNGPGVSTVYNRTTGATLRPPVTIPAAMTGETGTPSGVVFNGTTDFGSNKFIFASEDGIISAWSSGNAAVKVADRSSFNAVYKGLTIANDGTGNFLYVTDFHNGKIDVYDKAFNLVTNKPFIDPTMPAGYAPFNIQKIGQDLYVTYAKQGPDRHDDEAGHGNGYIDVFRTNGTFSRRFFSRGDLNSPWGIALAPAGFAADKQAILIGNFGDGKINVFDNMGTHYGELQSGGKALVIDGLWAIDFLNGNVPNTGKSTDWLYFTAGPEDESHGLFGYLHK